MSIPGNAVLQRSHNGRPPRAWPNGRGLVGTTARANCPQPHMRYPIAVERPLLVPCDDRSGSEAVGPTGVICERSCNLFQFLVAP